MSGRGGAHQHALRGGGSQSSSLIESSSLPRVRQPLTLSLRIGAARSWEGRQSGWGWAEAARRPSSSMVIACIARVDSSRSSTWTERVRVHTCMRPTCTCGVREAGGGQCEHALKTHADEHASNAYAPRARATRTRHGREHTRWLGSGGGGGGGGGDSGGVADGGSDSDGYGWGRDAPWRQARSPPAARRHARRPACTACARRRGRRWMRSCRRSRQS